METMSPIPRVLASTRSSITLAWNDTSDNTTDNDSEEEDLTQYTLQIKDRVRGWINVYWGFRTEFEVTGLGPQDCYVFRLKVKWKERESDWSPVVTSTTKDDQVAIVGLFRAIQYGQPKNAKKILTNRYGAVEICNPMGMSPLMQATVRGDSQMVGLLLNSGADVNAISAAAERTALMYACLSGETTIARQLSEKGASWNIRDRNGCTALHYAVDGSQMDTLELALEEGASIDAKDSQEWTPLMRGVVLESCVPVLQRLLENGALVNAVDRRGQTCLMQAVLSGRQEVVKMLLDAGADQTPCNMYHNTALDMAHAKDHKDIIVLLAPKPMVDKNVKKWKGVIKEKIQN